MRSDRETVGILKITIPYSESRDSGVGIATNYGLEDEGVGFRVPMGQEFSILYIVQTGSFLSNRYQGLFPGRKSPGA
jgi:hypothetical protein